MGYENFARLGSVNGEDFYFSNLLEFKASTIVILVAI